MNRYTASFAAALVIEISGQLLLSTAARADQVRTEVGITNTGFMVVRGNVTINYTYEDIEKMIETNNQITSLQNTLSFTKSQVSYALQVAGEFSIPDNQIGHKLIEIMTRYKILQEQTRPVPTDDPRIAELKMLARDAAEQGDPDRAENLLRAADIQVEAVHMIMNQEIDNAINNLNEADNIVGDLLISTPTQHNTKASAGIYI